MTMRGDIHTEVASTRPPLRRRRLLPRPTFGFDRADLRLLATTVGIALAAGSAVIFVAAVLGYALRVFLETSGLK